MTSASWQPDPSGRHETRWWDGERWTDHVADHGLSSTDPLVRRTPTSVAPSTVQPPVVQPPTMAQPLNEQPAEQPAEQPPTMMMQPTMVQQAITPPDYEQQRWAPESPPNRIPWIIGGVVAAILIVIGAIVVLSDDDTTGTTATSTIPESTLVETSLPQETTTSTSPTTTLPPVVATGPLLVSVLPGDADVPAEWARTADADPAPQSLSGPGIGFCGGANSVGRAQLAGSSAQAYGPTWDLPDATKLAVDAYAFPTESEAAAYLTAVLKDANACPGNPVLYSVTEAEAQWFTADGFDDALWAVDEHSGATKEATAEGDEAVQAFVQQHFAVTVADTDYEVTTTTVLYYERWGKVVLTYSLFGRWGFSGWPDPSEFEHQPTLDELLTAAGQVRGAMVQRLSDAGLR